MIASLVVDHGFQQSRPGANLVLNSVEEVLRKKADSPQIEADAACHRHPKRIIK